MDAYANDLFVPMVAFIGVVLAAAIVVFFIRVVTDFFRDLMRLRKRML